MTPPFGSPDTCTKEYRFAVVMYGGVSLAIYMNGIAQELLSLVRSTAFKEDMSEMLTDLTGTQAVYRDLALRLSQENDGQVHVRFIIDIISGTSAGGINGIFLAKAMAARKDMESLKRTWIDEGDFQKLLNDQSYSDTSIDLPKQVPPRSLLSGESMYLKLFDAFAEMDQDPGLPYTDEINLWVTTTDLYGAVLPLRLADRVVFERKYKQAFYFRHSKEAEQYDFKRENTPFLAFAARCTSSFPVAFEPMQLDSIQKLLPFSKKFTDGNYNSTLAAWNNFFAQNDPKVKNSERFFADGAYLDNHPFDHAIEGLQKQSSSVLSERKLLYIEPSPEHPERENAMRDRTGKLIQPDAIENTWDAIAGIPGKQPIRDNLVLIQERNRLIRKVNSVISVISSSIENSPLTQELRAPRGARKEDTQSSANTDAWKNLLRQVGFRAYTALNIFAVTDDLAVRIARILKYDDSSDYVYAIRCLIKVWRVKHYGADEPQFLLDFDISYRMRRYRFVKSQLEMLSRLDSDAKDRLGRTGVPVPEGKEQERAFRNEIVKLRGVFDQSYRMLRKTSDLARQAEEIRAKINELTIEDKDLDEILGVKSDPSKKLKYAPRPAVHDTDFEKRAQTILTPAREEKLNLLAGAIDAVYSKARRAARTLVENAIEPSNNDSPMRVNVLRLARLYFYGYQEFDAAIFPITYGTDVGELDPVDVIRISPEDAVAIVDETETGRHKLAGTAFGAFGAFLERVWRTNDILWGRLDGAERIIRAITPAGTNVDDLIRRAHDIIIDEELKPANRADICQMLVDALLRTGSGAKADEQRAEMLSLVQECTESDTGSTDINPKLVAVLQRSLTPEQLRCCLANFQISREPNRKLTLENVARASRIIGRILEDLSRKRPALKKPGTLMVQSGNVIWGLLEVSIPGSIWGAFFNYWFSLMMLFSIVMIVGGTFLSPPVQALGFRLLALALATKFSVETLRRFISGEKTWWRVLEAVFICVVIALLVLGLVELQNISEHLGAPIQAARDWIARILHGN